MKSSLTNIKKKALISSAVALGLISTVNVANACSRLLWETQDHGIFVSRTMDWLNDTQPTIDVRAKGQSYVGAEFGENVAKWTSQYASIMVTFYQKAGVDGFNEAGLAANALYHDEENGGTYHAQKTQLENSRVVPYILDNFASVKEAIEGLKNIQIQQFIHDGSVLKGHYSLQDTSGDSAVIEFINGETKIYHGEQYNVLTNSPEYPQHLANWEQQKPTSKSEINSSFELKGNVASDQRFVWNKYMLSQLTEPSSHANGLAKINSATYHVPLDAANRLQNGEMTTYATQYSLAYNLKQKDLHVRYQYGDTYTHYFVEFDKLNDGKNYVLDASADNNYGNVTGKFMQKNGVMAQYQAQ